MPKFAPKPGDTIHTVSKGDFICRAYLPEVQPWCIRGPIAKGHYPSWDENGRAYPRNGDDGWDITHITPQGPRHAQRHRHAQIRTQNR